MQSVEHLGLNVYNSSRDVVEQRWGISSLRQGAALMWQQAVKFTHM